MSELCYVRVKKELVRAEFIGVFQFSNVLDPSPMIGGHTGGVIAYPVVVVKVDGRIKDFSLSSVQFERANVDE